MPPTPAVGGDREGCAGLGDKSCSLSDSLDPIGFQARHIVVPNPIAAKVQARGQRTLVCVRRGSSRPSCVLRVAVVHGSPRASMLDCAPVTGPCVCSDGERGVVLELTSQLLEDEVASKGGIDFVDINMVGRAFYTFFPKKYVFSVFFSFSFWLFFIFLPPVVFFLLLLLIQCAMMSISYIDSRL